MGTNSWPVINTLAVVPRSGYINRLQAVASAAGLAQQLNAQFQVCWQSQPVAPAPAESILSADFIENFVIDGESFRKRFGYDCSNVPRYLKSEPGVISLAGYEHGEQVYMPELKAMIHRVGEPTDVVISAGGNFSFENQETAIEQRGQWYRNFDFAAPIEKAARTLIEDQNQFVGLHLRYTDRSHETPLDREVHAAVMQQVERTGTTSIFIASDTRGKRDKWLDRLSQAGLKPWSAQLESHDRANELAGIGAMVDWKILGSATTSVYFAASSFGHEAAVMAGSTGTSIALLGHPVRRWQSRSREWFRAAIYYPRNHWGR